MDEKKTDRRIKYTKMVIKDSFIKFLRQKPISKITVKEICDDADINRATFYAHYLDPYDLLQQIENEIIDDINQYLNVYDFQKSESVMLEVIEKILEYIGDNAELFDLLLNLNGDIKFQQEIINIIGSQHFPATKAKKTASPEDAIYTFHFLASGAVGVIQLWLKDGRKKTSRQMAELILSVATNGQLIFD